MKPSGNLIAAFKRETSSKQFVTRSVVYLSVLTAMATLALELDDSRYIGVAILIGAIIAHGTELSHQSLHGIGFRKSKLDRAFGSMACGLSLVSFSKYSFTHLGHHRFNGMSSDSESFSYELKRIRDRRLSVRLAGFVSHLLMTGHWRNAAISILQALTGTLDRQLVNEHPSMKASVRHAIVAECLGMGAFIMLLSALAIVLGWWKPLAIWLIAMLAWSVVHSLIELPEHWGTDGRPQPDAFLNTRTITAGRIGSYFTNGNCFHVEHHYNAQVPMNQLREYHSHLKACGYKHAHLSASYPEFYADLLRQIVVGPAAATNSKTEG